MEGDVCEHNQERREGQASLLQKMVFEKKAEMDKQTGCDVYEYLIVRHIEKQIMRGGEDFALSLKRKYCNDICPGRDSCTYSARGK